MDQLALGNLTTLTLCRAVLDEETPLALELRLSSREIVDGVRTSCSAIFLLERPCATS
jgi:alpha-D-ribose 1-methylphosphonate 5-triphosphate synthase subunit PhnH